MRSASIRSVIRSAPAIALGAASLALTFAGPATAADGGSTPGVTVTAVNPGTWKGAGDLKVTLAAHTEASTVANPSCRPQDVNLECWGSLLLRLPTYGDLAVGNLEVHRVAVGDIACDDESGEDGGCGDHEMGVAALTGADGPVQAQVNGLAVVKWPGNTGLEVGTKLQVKFTLTDNGSAPYQDQLEVQVNRFQPGSVKPLLWASGPQTVKQVQIHFADDGS